MTCRPLEAVVTIQRLVQALFKVARVKLTGYPVDWSGAGGVITQGRYQLSIRQTPVDVTGRTSRDMAFRGQGFDSMRVDAPPMSARSKQAGSPADESTLPG